MRKRPEAVFVRVNDRELTLLQRAGAMQSPSETPAAFLRRVGLAAGQRAIARERRAAVRRRSLGRVDALEETLGGVAT